MAQIISATTRFAAAGLSGKRVQLLTRAHELLLEARQQVAAGNMDQAVEFAYQAALRGAGAWVVNSPVGRRKRLPSSAWEQLALVKGEAVEWVARFRPYSQLRSRLLSGLDDGVEETVALECVALVAEFLMVIEYGAEIPLAA